MSQESLLVAPGPDAHSVRTNTGQVLRVPEGWELLPPHDVLASAARPVRAVRR